MFSGTFTMKLYIVTLRSTLFPICPSSNDYFYPTCCLGHLVCIQLHFASKAFLLLSTQSKLLHLSCIVFSVTLLMQHTRPNACTSLYLHMTLLCSGPQRASVNRSLRILIPFYHASLLERVSCPRVNTFRKTKSPYCSCSSTVCFFC